MRCICYIVLSSRCSRHKTFYYSSRSTQRLSRKILYHRHHMGCIEKYHNHHSEQLYDRRSYHTRHPCIHDNVSSSLGGIHDTTFHHSPNNFSEIRAYLYKKLPATSALFHFYAFKTVVPATIIATGELVASEIILLKFAVSTIIGETFTADSIWRIIAVWVGAGNIHLLVSIRPINVES